MRLAFGVFFISISLSCFNTEVTDDHRGAFLGFQRVSFVHWSRRLRASCRFSSEFATLNRRYPSPNAPKDVPERAATPACSRSASASGFDFHPVCLILGKTQNAPFGLRQENPFILFSPATNRSRRRWNSSRM